ESEYISELLGRPVVKVFNMLLGYTLKHNGKAAGEKGRIAVSIAGDNDEHKKIAAELVDQMGFDTVDGGSLALSWRQEPGTPAFCTELNAAELELALPKAEKGKAPARRDYIIDKLMKFERPPAHEEVVSLMRSGSAGNLM
ncbi:NADPH-dependent F420 reductase, partial [Pedobacter sp. Leaf176]|uniref:NADPH-dependent F420 reductase n=1 Tax=Pedobacter sp. Leaf176 TaxID=1736286 RepID=UPI000AF001C9